MNRSKITSKNKSFKKNNKSFKKNNLEAITITFKDSTEVGGIINLEKILKFRDDFLTRGFRCELVDFNSNEDYEDAYILIVRNAINSFVNMNELMDEIQNLNWNRSQEISLEDQLNMPLLEKIKREMEEKINSPLIAEGKKYYETFKINYDRISDRRNVISLHFGINLSIYYQWYYQNKIIGDPIKIDLNQGDIYLMSDKITERKGIFTLHQLTISQN